MNLNKRNSNLHGDEENSMFFVDLGVFLGMVLSVCIFIGMAIGSPF